MNTDLIETLTIAQEMGFVVKSTIVKEKTFRLVRNDNRLDLGIRPKCSNDGCDNDCQFMGSYRKDGTPQFRKVCTSCHNKNVAENRGYNNITEVIASNAGFSSFSEYKDELAKVKGFKNNTEYENSKHPYRRHRKDYCENTDGRLGFVCTTTIHWEGMLDVDHIDGNPKNNKKENCQTLCKCCHSFKTNMEKDYLSPGRKSLGVKY